jgi:SPIRAL1-like protein
MGSLIFGGGDSAPESKPAARRQSPFAVSEEMTKAMPMAKAPMVESKAVNVPAPVHDGAAKGTTSANVFANGANQNCGNFITDRPTSRVLSAPGGKSSMGGLLNWGH